MGKHPNGLCDACQVEESVNHLLLECKKENISTILKNQCEIYKSEFNFKTLLDIGCMQGEVYKLVKLINKRKIL